MSHKPSQRLLALDILRGITIAGMITVNNPGSWSYVYAPLGHAEWNGLTPTDLVFPFFMFIMGISTYISLRKYQFTYSAGAAWKIVRRTVVIFAIGLAIAWFGLSCRTWHALAEEGLPFTTRLFRAMTNFGHLRILGVMPRLALCYGATALIALTVSHRRIPHLIVAILAGYSLLLFLGNGFAYDETNILSVVDRAVLGPDHMYKDNGIEPEGLLSTLPAIAHVLVGFCCGALLLGVTDVRDKMLRLFLAGTAMALGGWLLSYGCPINKKIWSPTFVLTTCGMAASLLALLVWIIDVRGHRRWCRFFESFGVNPLFMYVLAAVFAILLGNIRVSHGGGETVSLGGFLYGDLLRPLLGDYPGSLAYALLLVTTCWCVGYSLYKRNIYIKI
mgnify:CR=1 FL=1